MYRGVRGLLLIDDQAAQAGLITAMATRASWRVVRAIDPATALTIARARRSRLDAILFDSCSPRDTIVAAVSSLRQQCPDIPVVVITAQDSAALAIEAIRAGASDFIVKPITPDRLFAALDHATSKDRDVGSTAPRGRHRSAVPFRTASAAAAACCDIASSERRLDWHPHRYRVSICRIGEKEPPPRSRFINNGIVR